MYLWRGREAPIEKLDIIDYVLLGVLTTKRGSETIEKIVEICNGLGLIGMIVRRKIRSLNRYIRYVPAVNPRIMLCKEYYNGSEEV